MEFIIAVIIITVVWWLYAKRKSRDFSSKLIGELVKRGMSTQLADDYYSANHEKIHHMYFKQKFDVSYIASSLADGWNGQDRYRADGKVGDGRRGVVSLFSPNRDYTNQKFRIAWNHEIGSHIKKGEIIYRLKGSSQTLSITADKDCHITKKECVDGYEVKRSGMLLGKINDPAPRDVEARQNDTKPTNKVRQSSTDTAADIIEHRLLELKRLHKKGLISKEVYSEQQKKILNDL